jgi:hypothetical protein
MVKKEVDPLLEPVLDKIESFDPERADRLRENNTTRRVLAQAPENPVRRGELTGFSGKRGEIVPDSLGFSFSPTSNTTSTLNTCALSGTLFSAGRRLWLTAGIGWPVSGNSWHGYTSAN